MTYLLFGVGIINLLMVISCGKVLIEYIMEVDHIYVNHTGQSLTMEVYNEHEEMFKSFNLENGDSINTHTSRGRGLEIFFFASTTYEAGDSVIVRFADDKCLTYLDLLTNNEIFDEKEYDNYSEELIEPGTSFTLYYTFTEEDYSLAVDCE